jgi:hypothetical protein
MNKKNVALILGLMLNIVPVCCAEEVQTPAQESATQVCTDACEVVPAEPAEVVKTENTTTVETAAPEVVPSCDVNPEEELTEEQLKELLDQIIAEVKKEEEAKKKKDAAAQTGAVVPAAE